LLEEFALSKAEIPEHQDTNWSPLEFWEPAQDQHSKLKKSNHDQSNELKKLNQRKSGLHDAQSIAKTDRREEVPEPKARKE
jgi:hypothetical protein